MSDKKGSSSHFDDIIKTVSEFGRWQKFIYFTTCALVIVPSGIHIAGMYVITGTPKFHCVTPNWNLICDFGAISDIFGRRFCMLLCSILAPATASKVEINGDTRVSWIYDQDRKGTSIHGTWQETISDPGHGRYKAKKKGKIFSLPLHVKHG
ncbi:hypothetical protein OS493_035439 [Desmophyllum pertusum]|uniref:Uncharacterized protein n=1 Tax=Desmophyllum pertusum TaxID=174260 RepID=A0A9X0D1L8_9CNID|nr:hypothetical protein OS493_035439 [Desmophyllum pertusum]